MIHHVVSISEDEWRSLTPGFVFLFLWFLLADGEAKWTLHEQCFTFLLVRIYIHITYSDDLCFLCQQCSKSVIQATVCENKAIYLKKKMLFTMLSMCQIIFFVFQETGKPKIKIWKMCEGKIFVFMQSSLWIFQVIEEEEEEDGSDSGMTGGSKKGQ